MYVFDQIPYFLDRQRSTARYSRPMLKTLTLAVFFVVQGAFAAESVNVVVERVGKKLKASVGGKTLLEYQAEPGEFP